MRLLRCAYPEMVRGTTKAQQRRVALTCQTWQTWRTSHGAAAYSVLSRKHGDFNFSICRSIRCSWCCSGVGDGLGSGPRPPRWREWARGFWPALLFAAARGLRADGEVMASSTRPSSRTRMSRMNAGLSMVVAMTFGSGALNRESGVVGET